MIESIATEHEDTVRAPRENFIRSRVNAAFFHLMDGYMHWKYAAVCVK